MTVNLNPIIKMSCNKIMLHSFRVTEGYLHDRTGLTSQNNKDEGDLVQSKCLFYLLVKLNTSVKQKVAKMFEQNFNLVRIINLINLCFHT